MTAPGPAASEPASSRGSRWVEDEDLLPYVLRRVRERREGPYLAAVLACAVALSVTGRLLGRPGVTAVGMVFALAAVVLIAVFAMGRRAEGGLERLTDDERLRREAAAAEKRSARIPVVWMNRPATKTPRNAQATPEPHELRLASEAIVLWDVLVMAGAAAAAAIPFGLRGWLVFGPVFLLAGYVGLPRRRRVEQTVPWEEITDVAIDGTAFEIRTRMAPPADTVLLDARYSARERLTAALRERLGDRVRVAREVPPNRPRPDDRVG